MLLAGSTLEALQVIYFVFHAHGHLIGTDPLVAGSAETVLTKKPGAKRGGGKAKRWGRDNRQEGLVIGSIHQDSTELGKAGPRQIQGCTSEIPVLRRLRQEDGKVQAGLGHTVICYLKIKSQPTKKPHPDNSPRIFP